MAGRRGDASRLVTFTSDYGTEDEFVGVCRLVIARLGPQVRVIDVAHGVRGVAHGAAVLAQSVPYAPEAVHLAIVDPGVGTERRGVVVEVASGGTLIGPDNGLLVPAAEALGGIVDAFEVTEPAYRLERVSPTFHGRDIFAPAAAHVALGVRPSDLGPPIEAAHLARLPSPLVRVREGRLEADVLRTDHFGNLQLAAAASDLAAARLGGRVRVVRGGIAAEALVGRTFADVGPGEIVVYVDSAEHAAVAVNGGSAAELLNGPGPVLVERSESPHNLSPSRPTD